MCHELGSHFLQELKLTLHYNKSVVHVNRTSHTSRMSVWIESIVSLQLLFLLDILLLRGTCPYNICLHSLWTLLDSNFQTIVHHICFVRTSKQEMNIHYILASLHCGFILYSILSICCHSKIGICSGEHACLDISQKSVVNVQWSRLLKQTKTLCLA